jgi:DNA-binding MarR family transcriptional regulator
LRPQGYQRILSIATIVARSGYAGGVTTETTRWLTNAEMAAWRSYAETVVDLNAALEADLAPHGLTLGDYQVLVYLSEAPDHQMRMCDLAALLQLSPSGLTRRLDGLVRMGVVERRPSDLDRRVMLAVLTDHGWSYLEKVAPDHVESVRRHIIDLLSAEDMAAMARIFRTIASALRDPSQP